MSNDGVSILTEFYSSIYLPLFKSLTTITYGYILGSSIGIQKLNKKIPFLPIFVV